MKKIILGFSALVIFVGCSNDSNEKDSEETKKTEEKVMSESEYYDIVLESIGSSKEGNVSGESVSGVLQGGVSIKSYSGILSSNNVSLNGTESSVGESEFTVESNLKTPSEELMYVTNGMNTLYDIDITMCTVSDKILTCNIDELTEENGVIDANKYEYEFTFDDNNELISISIDYALLGSFTKFGEGDFVLEDEALSFLDDPYFKFFVDKPVSGNLGYGSELIEY